MDDKGKKGLSSSARTAPLLQVVPCKSSPLSTSESSCLGTLTVHVVFLQCPSRLTSEAAEEEPLQWENGRSEGTHAEGHSLAFWSAAATHTYRHMHAEGPAGNMQRLPLA
eukprot:scaffold105648_cov24-Tisochrysis_lutea.AAC.1